jgi:hypothetical protein
MENIHLTNKRLHSETLLEGVSLVFPRFPLSFFFQLSGGSTSPHHFPPQTWSLHDSPVEEGHRADQTNTDPYFQTGVPSQSNPLFTNPTRVHKCLNLAVFRRNRPHSFSRSLDPQSSGFISLPSPTLGLPAPFNLCFLRPTRTPPSLSGPVHAGRIRIVQRWPRASLLQGGVPRLTQMRPRLSLKSVSRKVAWPA